MEEIEVKFLDVDVIVLRKKFKKLGAKKIFDKLYRRKMFDYPDWRLNKAGSWLRLRDEGDQVTLVYKRRLGMDPEGKKNDEGMEEVEVQVQDFDQTALIFDKIGFIVKRYTENKRERWQLGDITFDLDTYPLLPTYLEIETDSWEKIDQAISLLGLNPADKKIYSATQIYKDEGINENDYDLITFEKQVKKKKIQAT